MNTNLINQLKAGLISWEQQVMEAIVSETQRIARPVQMNELPDNPFITEVSIYVDTIWLELDHEVMLETSFADTDKKKLESFMSDSEIDSWGLLGLLDGLTGIPH